MAKKSYPVLSNILHDGDHYGPAEKNKAIELEEDDAEALIAAGVLGEGKAVKETPAKTA
ncbi:hypothetical protein [Bosea sp. 685]|uniref:hypothetical protein n=1 Tax=Bosea sp. 685 TaxID=3080057 RepID=UPI002892F8F6|nr:hypothetical protein [Bosea sp. 685]WNJ89165.1 hypothetical protein RMR04_22505 [Bosea sp. 685]